jgi:hypothetical protein
MAINDDLRSETKKLAPLVKEEKEANEKTLQKFDRYYYELNDDKIQMAKLLNEYNSVEADLNNQTLIVNKENLSFRIWILLSFILCIAVFRKMTETTGIPALDTIINIIFRLAIIILIFSLSRPAGFASLGLALILFLLYKLHT